MAQRRKKTHAGYTQDSKFYLKRTTMNFDLKFADVSIVCNALSTIRMSGNQDDFEFQLQSERLYAEKGTEGSWNKQSTYTDPSDGTVYEWDAEKNGWFPKIDDSFLAAYQASYGVPQPDTTPTDPTHSTPAVPNPIQTQSTTGPPGQQTTSEEKGPGSENPRKRKSEDGTGGGWFDIEDEKNHNVYVWGLPQDVTLEEFAELMSKYGIIMEDDEGEPKLKLYRDVNGEIKGDGLCCYLKIESVGLALQLLDGLQLRGNTVRVEKAKFSLKGSYNPALKKTAKKKKKKAKGGGQEKLLDWRERRSTATQPKTKYDKVVIIRHAFHPKEFEEDAMLINEIRDDLREECEKFGVVKKVLLFDRHPEGVASIGFKEVESAAACAQAMNRRWYGGRQLEVQVWDGVTNYQVEETEKEREERLKQWENFLEEDEGEEGGGERGQGGSEAQTTVSLEAINTTERKDVGES